SSQRFVHVSSSKPNKLVTTGLARPICTIYYTSRQASCQGQHKTLYSNARCLSREQLSNHYRRLPAMSEKHEVRIHIDEHPCHSPNPTDGEALYVLGRVKPGLEFYREVTGNQEDQAVPRSKEHIHLAQDEHFHSGEPHQGEFSIIV